MRLTATTKRWLAIATLIALGAYHAPIIGAMIKNVMEAPVIGTITPLTIFGVAGLVLAYLMSRGDF